jgi:hypothetical protein
MSLRRLPPLNALRAFEAAARLESMSRAAEELSVTHAAVSHQVKALEEWVGHGSKSDAYATFKGMLDGGNPPDDFDALLKEAAKAARRFEEDLETGSLSGQG